MPAAKHGTHKVRVVFQRSATARGIIFPRDSGPNHLSKRALGASQRPWHAYLRRCCIMFRALSTLYYGVSNHGCHWSDRVRREFVQNRAKL